MFSRTRAHSFVDRYIMSAHPDIKQAFINSTDKKKIQKRKKNTKPSEIQEIRQREKMGGIEIQYGHFLLLCLGLVLPHLLAIFDRSLWSSVAFVHSFVIGDGLRHTYTTSIHNPCNPPCVFVSVTREWFRSSLDIICMHTDTSRVFALHTCTLYMGTLHT